MKLTQEQEQDDLLELTGILSWIQFVEWFGGLSVIEIEDECNLCWPEEFNEELAKRIFSALNEGSEK